MPDARAGLVVTGVGVRVAVAVGGGGFGDGVVAGLDDAPPTGFAFLSSDCDGPGSGRDDVPPADGALNSWNDSPVPDSADAAASGGAALRETNRGIGGVGNDIDSGFSIPYTRSNASEKELRLLPEPWPAPAGPPPPLPPLP